MSTIPPPTPNDQSKYFIGLQGAGTPGPPPLPPGYGGPGWAQFFGDGSDGALNVASGTTTLTGSEFWYSSINVAAGATLTNITANLPIILRSTGPVVISGTVAPLNNLATTSTAFGGGSGGGGGGGTAAGAIGVGMSIGGRGIQSGGAAGAASGGNGGNGGQLAPNYLKSLLAEGLTPQLATSTPLGGGAGGNGGTGAAAGGGGGACLVIIAPSITINPGAVLNCAGAPGTASAANNNGGGGGGGGGLIILATLLLAQNGTLNVAAGAGGGVGAFTGAGAGGAGGAGNTYILTLT